MNFARPSRRRTSMNPPPPIFPADGSTTASAKPTATAASTALPPFFRISTPASEASASSHTTMACSPRTADAGQLGWVVSPAEEAYSRGWVGVCCGGWDLADTRAAQPQKMAANRNDFIGVRMAELNLCDWRWGVKER